MYLPVFDMFIPTTETGQLWTKRNSKRSFRGLKTEADLNPFSRMLTKLTVETALNTELTDHFGHEKNAPKKGSNTRNGYSSKTLLSDDGEIELNTPRCRENTFEPQLIKKNQTRITQMDSQILSLYAKGMTTREIVATFKEMYDADVSPTLISKVIRAAIKKRKVFPTDGSVRKVIYLAMSRFIIEFGDRLNGHL